MNTEFDHPCYSQKEFIRDDPPPLPHLLSGNEPPTEAMLLPLKSSARRVSAAIDEVQTEISCVSDPVVLKFLNDKRARLHAIYEEYKTVLSPLRRVPPEVLAKIFFVHRTQRDSDTYYDVFDVHAGPWTLSRKFGLTCQSNSGRAFLADVKKILSHYYELRSRTVGGCLLSLEINDDVVFLPPKWNEVEDSKLNESLLKILLSQSQRWKSAILSISPELYRLLPVLHGRIPELETFSIFVSMPVDADISRSFDVLAIAPRLKYLALQDLGSDLTSMIEASHLVTFCDNRQTMDRTGTLHHMYLSIIRDAPSLEEFSVGYQCHYEVALPDASPRIVHQALRDLTVGEAAILRSLDLPNLASATIQRCSSPYDAQGYIYQDVLPALLNLITRSGCILTALRIADTGLDEHIFSILSVCPNLNTLELRFSRWHLESDDADRVLQTLVERMAETTTNNPHILVLVPLLKDLSICMYDPESDMEDDEAVGFINSAFVRMLKVRLDCKSPLWSIGVHDLTNRLIYAMLDQDDIQQLKVWGRDRKLDISMRI
ncbi:hypothetical protein EDD18DRAFT_1349833 [Armillaria luteobubalina]|uniref:F-box domain-containing protein n=1 Tax=Armillaria luteobubalina TaxID=153913 RepID=A0AA39QDE0_9AGAR|nr:hypothetical protein EDD18DRAFT_1349833 [Armillaria luteobubalina]